MKGRQKNPEVKRRKLQSLTTRSSTRANAGFCSWEGTTLAIYADWGLRGWRAHRKGSVGFGQQRAAFEPAVCSGSFR